MKLMSRMGTVMLSKLGRRALIVCSLGLLLLLGFQNCGKAGFDSVSSAQPDAQATGLTAIQNSAPFAFKANFDTIAYNSCFGNQLASKAPFFTFRAGAYAFAGAHVNKSFMDYARTKLNPSYPNPTVTVNQFKDLALNSAINKDAQIIFAMRQLSNVQDPNGIYRTGNTATPGVDYYNILGPLTDDRWLNSMMTAAAATTDEPDYMQYFIQAPRGYRNVEVSHVWNTSEALAQSIRSAFRGDAALSLTFQVAGGSNGQSKSPTTDPTKAFGLAYKLNFGVEIPAYLASCKPVFDDGTTCPAGTIYVSAANKCQNTTTGAQTNPTIVTTRATYNTWIGCSSGGPDLNPVPDNLNPDNIVSSIQEVDLETGMSAPTAWQCNAKMRFMIVRPSDQAAMCPPGEDGTNIATGRITDIAGYYQDLEKVRRVLPANEWDVNLTRRCAVPKEADCYSQEKLNNLLVPVQYDVTKTCFQAIDGVSYPKTPVDICAQHITICTK